MASSFNRVFAAMWKEDGFRDYLAPPVAGREEARDVLSRLLSRGSGVRAARPASCTRLLMSPPHPHPPQQLVSTSEKSHAGDGQSGGDGDGGGCLSS